MEKAFAEMKEMLAKHMEREEEQMEKLLTKLDEKFASKWVERIVAGGVVMILVSFGTHL
jgi:DNA-binding protein YbaB